MAVKCSFETYMDFQWRYTSQKIEMSITRVVRTTDPIEINFRAIRRS
jgi:hypothetical protein